MHLKQLFSLIPFIVISSHFAFAAEIGYTLSGSVAQSFFPVFGYWVGQGTPVNGQFVYSTNSTATHMSSSCTCVLGYQQRHINGFRLNFDDLVIQADSYVIEIGNDVPQPNNQPPIDTFSVAFGSDLMPPLPDPLLVNGQAYSSGVNRVTLVADRGLFSDLTLPQSLDPSDFTWPSRFNVLADTSPGFADVLYDVIGILPADFRGSDHDLDGDVDGRDFLIWQRYYGATGQNGDATADGIVNVSDLQAWHNQYGTGPQASRALTIPEPVTVTSATLLFAMGFAIRARHIVPLAQSL